LGNAARELRLLRRCPCLPLGLTKGRDACDRTRGRVVCGVVMASVRMNADPAADLTCGHQRASVLPTTADSPLGPARTLRAGRERPLGAARCADRRGQTGGSRPDTPSTRAASGGTQRRRTRTRSPADTRARDDARRTRGRAISLPIKTLTAWIYAENHTFRLATATAPSPAARVTAEPSN